MDANFAAPICVYHLSGGLRLVVGNNDQAWLADVDRARALLFSLPNSAVRSLVSQYSHLEIIGRNRFAHALEMEESIAPNFALSAMDENHQCLAFSQNTNWGGISYALYQDGYPEFSFRTRRLATQISKSRQRLEKLSNAYALALPSAAIPEQGSISFQGDKFASNVGNEFGSLLDDLYGLRDAINAVLFKDLLHDEKPFSTANLRKALQDKQLGPTASMVSQSMFDQVNGDLLISRMSTYRAVALHSLGTSNPVTGDSLIVSSKDGPLGTVSRLVYPLYDDIAQLREIEAGRHFPARPSRDDFERFARLENHEDAMDFALTCFERLLRTAESLAKEVAVAPRHLTITDADIISADIPGKNSQRLRLIRDPDTGELVEVSDS